MKDKTQTDLFGREVLLTNDHVSIGPRADSNWAMMKNSVITFAAFLICSACSSKPGITGADPIGYEHIFNPKTSLLWPPIAERLSAENSEDT